MHDWELLETIESISKTEKTASDPDKMADIILF